MIVKAELMDFVINDDNMRIFVEVEFIDLG